MYFSAINKTELRLLTALHEDQLRQLRGIVEADVNCRRCVHGGTARPGVELCDKWKTTPPEDVQKVGCDDWEWDSIPF